MDWHGLGLVGAFEQMRRKSKFDFILLEFWPNFLFFGANLFLLLADVGDHLHSLERYMEQSIFFLLTYCPPERGFQFVGLPRCLKGGFHLRSFFIFSFSLFFSNPLTTSCRFSINEPIWGASKEVFTWFLIFSLIFHFFSNLLYLKNKITFKYKNTSNGARCTSGW